MMYAEISYFDGFHFAHIADWQRFKHLEHRSRMVRAGGR